MSIHGPATTSTATAATIFGMKESVDSLIWVAAWKMLDDEADAEHGEQDRRRDHEQDVEACWPKREDGWESMCVPR